MSARFEIDGVTFRQGKPPTGGQAARRCVGFEGWEVISDHGRCFRWAPGIRSGVDAAVFTVLELPTEWAEAQVWRPPYAARAPLTILDLRSTPA